MGQFGHIWDKSKTFEIKLKYIMGTEIQSETVPDNVLFGANQIHFDFGPDSDISTV